MALIERTGDDADHEPVTINYRYVGRVADDRDRWVIELPAGTTIRDGSILRIDPSSIDVTPAVGESLTHRTFRLCDAGSI
jgi:hypothetical protein